MKHIYNKVKKIIINNLLVVGITMLLCEILVLTTDYIAGSDSNVPLWISLLLMICGVSMIVVKSKKSSRY